MPVNLYPILPVTEHERSCACVQGMVRDCLAKIPNTCACTWVKDCETQSGRCVGYCNQNLQKLTYSAEKANNRDHGRTIRKSPSRLHTHAHTCDTHACSIYIQHRRTERNIIIKTYIHTTYIHADIQLTSIYIQAGRDMKKAIRAGHN